MELDAQFHYFLTNGMAIVIAICWVCVCVYRKKLLKLSKPLGFPFWMYLKEDKGVLGDLRTKLEGCVFVHTVFFFAILL